MKMKRFNVMRQLHPVPRFFINECFLIIFTIIIINIIIIIIIIIVINIIIMIIIIIIIIGNGNRTERSPIRSVIIRAINKIGQPRSGSPICLITSMITDRIGRHDVLLPINHNFNKICDIINYFLNQNTRNSKFCFASSEKKAI